MRAIQIAHAEDPATKLQREIGDISWFKLFGPKLLVATYDPAAGNTDVRTKGGIILAQGGEASTLAEYRWQGKIGLVMAVGPLAFRDSGDGRFIFDGMKAEVGDWICYRASDGLQMMIDAHHFRVLDDVHVIGVIPQPDRVY